MMGFTVSDEIKAERKAICDACPDKRTVVGIEYCNLCKCAILMKTATKLASCPSEKWGQVK